MSVPLGYKHSQAAKDKMSRSHRGRKMSSETRLKISKALSGRKIAPEIVEKSASKHRGRITSQETKDKLSKSCMGKNKGHKHSQETKDYISRLNTGRRLTSDQKEKMSISISKALTGMKKSAEHRRKLSESMKRRWSDPNNVFNSNEYRKKHRIRRIAEIKEKNGISPNFNPKACEMIEVYGKEHGYNFQHALNGGEYHIKELGYFVDGYDKERNVVIEYLEPHHFSEVMKAQDMRRKKEIIDFLGCEYIELIDQPHIRI